jgi:hypothetical protein
MRIIEVVRCIPESVDFEFREQVLREFLEEPIEDHAAFDGALRMQDEDDFGEVRLVESFFDDLVTVSDVLGCVGEITLDQALDYIEKDTISYRFRLKICYWTEDLKTYVLL